MPQNKYDYHLKNGGIMTLEGDSQPSDNEVESIAREQKLELMPSDSNNGNIDLSNRPQVKNSDGSISTVRSMSFNDNGKEVLVPTIVNGKVVSDQEAIDHYRKTGEHLGKFNSIDEANKTAQQIHESEANKLPKVDNRGIVKKGWDFINEPLTSHLPDWLNPSKRVTTRHEAEGPATPEDWNIPFTGGAKWKGLRQGIEQGATDVLSGLTSPLNLATMAATAGAGKIPALGTIGRALSAPVAVHGGMQVIDPNSTMSERGFGLAEIAGGIAGMRGTHSSVPSATAPKIDELAQAKAVLEKYALTHKLPKIEPGTEIEYAQAIDPSFGSDIPSGKLSDTNFIRGQSEIQPQLENIANDIVQPKPHYKLVDGKLIPAERLGPNLDELSTSESISPVEQGSVDFEHPQLDSIANDIVQPPQQELPSSWNELLNRPKSKQQLLNEEALNRRKAAYDAKQVQSTPEPIQSEQPIQQELPTETGRNIPPNEPPSSNTPPVNPDEIPKQIIQNNQKTQFVDMMRKPEKENIIRQILDTNRSLLTSYDVSAPLRQGYGLAYRKEFWTSLDDMFKSWGSQKAFDAVQQSITDHPSGYFKRTVNAAGKEMPSIAEKAGLSLTDLVEHPEEMFRSRIADMIPGVTRSNRAYVAFLNKLRADTFASMMDSAKVAGKFNESVGSPKFGVDVANNEVLQKQIASFINNATGRGNLGVLEKNARVLSDVFFAPKLMASRVHTYTQVFNPKFYTELDPMVRKEALKSLLSVVGIGSLLGEVSKLVPGVQVSNDPSSSDFRKIRIGNTRIDPFGGYQQYAVGAYKIISGKSTSSTSGRITDLTAGRFRQQNRADVFSNFAANKLAPVPSFAWSWMQGKEFDGTPFSVKQALVTRVVPIIMQDLYELYKEDPKLLPLGVPAALGMGVQSYGR